MTANLVLVASYPKSGNTWVRLVFEHLRRSDRVGINAMSAGFYGQGRRALFDAISPANAADLLPEEIDSLLPSIFRRFSAECPTAAFMKVHDCAFRTREGNWLFPPECVRSAIYLVRHPFDVAVSSAHHFGLTVDRAVEVMAASTLVVSSTARRLPLAMHQHLGSWSGHVGSWTQPNPYPVTIARYEDLCASPVQEFERLANAAGIANSRQAVERAVEATRFERLQSEERAEGFRERPESSALFFRSGRPQTWHGELDEDLRKRLCADHGETMERFGYAADGGIRVWSAPPAAAARVLQV